MGLSRVSDELFYESYDGFKSHCIKTNLRFTILPKKCHLTGRVIWFKNAYRQTAMWTGPGDPVYETRWYDRYEFLLAQIKGTV